MPMLPPLAPTKQGSRRWDPRQTLLVLASLLGLLGCATGSSMIEGPEELSPCGNQPLPPGWTEPSSGSPEALLAPFLSCASPADFLALQQRVDMPRLVARLDAWSAVRLGAQGPVREEAAGALNRQRTAFLLQSLERYGPAFTEVLAHFVLDTSHDDDLRDILFLLTQDKQLVRLLEQLPSLGPALEARGLEPSAHPERDFQWSDVGRALGHVAREGLATSPLVNGASSTLVEFRALEAQLPPPYQKALEAVEHEQRWQPFSAGPLSLGVLDHMTFGVPLGLYGLVAGTGHGLQELRRGRYEQAVHDLAPTAVLVAVFTGGEGASWLTQARSGLGVVPRVLSGLEMMESRVRGLQETVGQLRGMLGAEGVQALAGYIRASREAGRLVAVGGVDAAVALHETRGDVGRAQALLSKAHPGNEGSSVGGSGERVRSKPGAAVADDAAWHGARQGELTERLGTLAGLVDEQTGLTQEVVEARLAAAEAESTSERLPKDMATLEKHRPSLETPPLGARDNPRWREYVAYYEGRLSELRAGRAAEGPLLWEAYERMRGWFARGVAFERAMVKLLREDAKLPRAQRRFLGGFDNPRIETYVGVKKPGTGLRYADALIIEQSQFDGQAPRVETFSFKSRNLSKLEGSSLEAQLREDAREALTKYGKKVDIRRSYIQSLLQRGSEVVVSQVRLVYEGKALGPIDINDLKKSISIVQPEFTDLEIVFQ